MDSTNTGNDRCGCPVKTKALRAARRTIPFWSIRATRPTSTSESRWVVCSKVGTAEKIGLLSTKAARSNSYRCRIPNTVAIRIVSSFTPSCRTVSTSRTTVGSTGWTEAPILGAIVGFGSGTTCRRGSGTSGFPSPYTPEIPIPSGSFPWTAPPCGRVSAPAESQHPTSRMMQGKLGRGRAKDSPRAKPGGPSSVRLWPSTPMNRSVSIWERPAVKCGRAARGARAGLASPVISQKYIPWK